MAGRWLFTTVKHWWPYCRDGIGFSTLGSGRENAIRPMRGMDVFLEECFLQREHRDSEQEVLSRETSRSLKRSELCGYAQL